MGFTAWLMLFYIIMAVFTIFAFRRKKKAIGICLVAVIVVSIIVLGYMWVTSPM